MASRALHDTDGLCPDTDGPWARPTSTTLLGPSPDSDGPGAGPRAPAWGLTAAGPFPGTDGPRAGPAAVTAHTLQETAYDTTRLRRPGRGPED